MKFRIIFVLCATGITASWAQEAPQFMLPADCTLGENCFLQQMPDVDSSAGAKDPFCGAATYDGHKGTDFRLRYFKDIENNVPVIASAPGKVLRLRDGVEDRLVQNNADRARVRNIECGNGMVIDHGGGWQSQYCHLKSGSISVNEGDVVKAGDPLGAVGSSGMSQFPHVHITITWNGEAVDPFSGDALGSNCNTELASENALWSDPAIADIGQNSTQILDLGFASGAVEHDLLAVEKPKAPDANSGAMVGWASLINLQKSDIMRAQIIAPDGSVFSSNALDPLDRSKATYSFFLGKRGAPKIGAYLLKVEVVRAGEVIVSAEKSIDIRS